MGKKRLAQLKEDAAKNKFGKITQISKDEYTATVTESSKEQPVICVLFSGNDNSRLMLESLSMVAAKFKHIKCVKIVGRECIDKYPEGFCPTTVLYKEGNKVGHIKGLAQFGGRKMNASTLEWDWPSWEC